MRKQWWMGVLLVGCGSSAPGTLDDLPNKRISMLISFDPPAPQSPAVAAALKFDDIGTCPPFGLSVDLDGVALEPSPAATGSDGRTCALGFYLTAAPPPVAPQSTVRFTHSSGEVSATFMRLLEPRAWTTSVVDGSSVRAGDVIEFVWSTQTDGIDQVDGLFVMGASQQEVLPDVVDATARVAVPPLVPGDWTLNVGGLVHAAVVTCNGAVNCASQIVRQDGLDLSIQ